ncbi:MAG: hypothetical protein EBV28_11610 [Betaproteobacteria bacterium]|nr:hypothetical protein [Betaproteobacteria bacterium]
MHWASKASWVVAVGAWVGTAARVRLFSGWAAQLGAVSPAAMAAHHAQACFMTTTRQESEDFRSRRGNGTSCIEKPTG